MIKQWALMVALVIGISPSHAFDSFEHSEMGDAAFDSAISKLNRARPGVYSRLMRQPNVFKQHEAIGVVFDGKKFDQFSFGDLVAIYGDYAVSFEKVNGPGMVKRAANLKEIVRGAGTSKFPGEFSHVMQLATNNPTHFSLRAAQAYVRWHRKAIIKAREKNNLWEALHYEALALHSFTDLFAFGHLLDNRQLTDRLYEWAKKKKTVTNISAAGRAKLATTAGKVMGGYVNFYHNAYNWKGAMMKNLAGDSWRGFGDKQYRIVEQSCGETTKLGRRSCNDPITKRQRQIIVHAASLSILDIFNSAAGKRLAVGKEYSAMCHLPVYYWDTQSPVDAEDQVPEILQLAAAMKKQGRPLVENGFDFDLGYLKFKKGEKRGTVKYVDYIRLYCGKN